MKNSYSVFLLSFFGTSIKNPKQNFITALCLIYTGSKNQGTGSEGVLDYVTNYIRTANVN